MSARLPAMLGLPKSQRGPAALGLSLMGDVRFALSLEAGVRLRVAVGSVNGPVEVPFAQDLPENFAAIAQLDLPKSALDFAVTTLKNCGNPCKIAGLDFGPLITGWSGKVVGVVEARRPDEPGPAVSLKDVLTRPRAALVAGFRGDGAFRVAS